MHSDSSEVDSQVSDVDGSQNVNAATQAEPLESSAEDIKPSSLVDADKPAMSKFVVRMPAELLETLKRVSRHHNRSMNTEINILLGRYIEQVKGESRPGVDEHLKLDSQLLLKLSALPEQKIEALLDLLD